MKKYILPLLTVLLPMVAFADAVEIDGIYYNLMEDIKGSRSNVQPQHVFRKCGYSSHSEL